MTINIKSLGRRTVLFFLVVVFVLGAQFFYTKWKLTHGWVMSLISYNTGEPEVLGKYVVVSTNLKSAMIRAEKYVKSKKICDVDEMCEIRTVENIGRMPWVKFGVRPLEKFPDESGVRHESTINK